MQNFVFFSKRLKLLRVSHDLSMSEMAELLFLKTSAAINEFESGRSKPTTETAINIATYFGVSLDWLFGLSGIPYTNDSVVAAEKAAFEREQKIDTNHDLQGLIASTAYLLKIEPKVDYYFCERNLAYRGNYVFLKNATFLNDLEHLQHKQDSLSSRLNSLFSTVKPTRLSKRKIERYKLFLMAYHGCFNVKEPIYPVSTEENISQ